MCRAVVHAFNLTLRRQREDLRVQGQAGEQSEFQGSQDYSEKPCLENKQLQNVCFDIIIHISIHYSKQKHTERWFLRLKSYP